MSGRDTLERTLGFRDLTLITVGVVIGSGIFIVPATVLRQVNGDVGTALLVWLIAGFLSLLGALTYGELGAMRPQAGGLYVYIREAFGPFVAFLFGWTMFLVIATGAVATLAAAFTGYLGQFFALGPITRKFAAVGMVLFVSGINIVGTRTSAGVQVWTTALKVAVLVLMSLVLLTHGAGLEMYGASLAPRGLSLAVLPGVGLAMVGVLWAYEGWQYVTFSAGETIDPQRTFPRALTIGTLILIGLYCLANVAYVAALGPERARESESIAAAAMASLFGSGAGRLVA
ncbi:MAG: amino acid permease, partial [Gemmatimonadetes bacterium]|nr:amino acid permease [Gemmatimonadota bacterium]